MKDKLSFPAFTHDSIAGYCNGNPLYAQYKNDKKSKYIGTKQMWQELSKLRWDLEIARKALEKYADEDMWENCCKWDIEYMQGLFLEHGYEIAKETLEQIEQKD